MITVLDQLLKTQFGKSLIMWFFLAMCVAIGGLAWYCYHQGQELKACNAEMIAAEKGFSAERERIIREQITYYQQLLKRLEAVERKKKR